MATYVYDKERGIMVDKRTGAPMVDGDGPLQTPMTFSDTPGYRSPITGEWIEGRRARRYDMQKHNCVDGNDISSGPKGFRNPKFAAKRGLTHLLK